MKLEIIPKVGVGLIRFGMPRGKIRELLKSDWKEVLKTKTAKIPVDVFDDINLHVYYGEDLLCKGVELFFPAEVELKGESVLRMPVEDLLPWLKKLVPDVLVEDSIIWVKQLGLRFYAPEAEDDSVKPPESVYLAAH
jgi:hypothetical protein